MERLNFYLLSVSISYVSEEVTKKWHISTPLLYICI